MWLGTSRGDASAQDGPATVQGSIVVSARPTGTVDLSGVVMWLAPIDDAARNPRVPVSARPRFQIVQKGKVFSPRVLVVPVGAVVEFPNLDPVFHNVFSLFDGRRFDLGLYEAGSTRGVTFTRAGVSHVFCNIHPDMSAVVVAVDTDHYSTTTSTGTFAIPNVPPGRYLLHVWNDRFKPEAGGFPRPLTVPASGTNVGALPFVDSGRALSNHKNKFGHDYVPPAATSPIYR